MAHAASTAGSTSKVSKAEASSIYSELRQLHDVFARLHDVARPETLHLLDGHTLAALSPRHTSLAGAASAAPHIDRKAFRAKVQGLRRSARAWRDEAVETRQTNLAGPSSASSSSTFARYTSLHKDTAQNIAHLAANLQPLSDLKRQIVPGHPTGNGLHRANTSPLPAVLYAGALHHSHPPLLPSTTSKRKRASSRGDSEPFMSSTAFSSDRSQAIKVLGSLAAALEELAIVLGLETFAEALFQSVGSSEAGDQLKTLHTHTLTLGGKLLVLDIELGLDVDTDKVPSRSFYPTTRVKLSFTNRTHAGHTSPIKEGEGSLDSNALTADLLRKDIDALARLLFGMTVDGEVVGTLQMSVEERRLRLARSHYNRYRSNLERLLELDRWSLIRASDAKISSAQAAESVPVDCFAALHQVAKSLEQVADVEHADIASVVQSQPSYGFFNVGEDDRIAWLAEFGHGVPLVHTGTVGVSIVYSLRGRKTKGESISNLMRRRGLTPAVVQHENRAPFSLGIVIEPQQLPLPPSAARVEDTSLKLGKETSFAPLPDLGCSSALELGFAAKLDPPILLPRRLFTRIAQVVGLPVESIASRQRLPNSSQAIHTGSTYVSLLCLDPSSSFAAQSSLTTATPSGARLRYQTKRSRAATPDDQDALLVSSVPFRSLSQLYLLLEILQEATAVQNLLESLRTTAEVCRNISYPLTTERAAAIVFDVIPTDVSVNVSASEGYNVSPASTPSPSLCFAVHLSARFPPIAGRFFVLSCYIHRDRNCLNSHGWRVTGGLDDTLALMGNMSSRPSAQHRRAKSLLELDEETQNKIGEILRQETHLGSAADLLLLWAWKTIDAICGTTESNPRANAKRVHVSSHDDGNAAKPDQSHDSDMVLVTATSDTEVTAPTKLRSSGEIPQQDQMDLRQDYEASTNTTLSAGAELVNSPQIPTVQEGEALVHTEAEDKGAVQSEVELEASRDEEEPVIRVEAESGSVYEGQAASGLEAAREAEAEEASPSLGSRRGSSSPISPRASPKLRRSAAGGEGSGLKGRTTTLQVDTSAAGTATVGRSGRGSASAGGVSPRTPNTGVTRMLSPPSADPGTNGGGAGVRSSARRTSRGRSTPSPSPTRGVAPVHAHQHAHQHQPQTRRRSHQAASAATASNGSGAVTASAGLGLGLDTGLPNTTSSGSAGAGAANGSGSASASGSGSAVVTRRASAMSAASSVGSGSAGTGGGSTS